MFFLRRSDANQKGRLHIDGDLATQAGLGECMPWMSIKAVDGFKRAGKLE